MPRRKAVSETQLLEPSVQLMLPPARPSKHHREDPYETPVGAVPSKVSNVQTTNEPIKRRMTKGDLAAREQARALVTKRANRYTSYLDLLIANGGNQIEALATVYGISQDEATERRHELQADVRAGVGATELGEILERNDLSMAARVNLLRRQAYSENAAASLKAIDILNDLEGGSGVSGSFESYLRLAKAQK